jgi:hypothetical protein
MRVSSAVFIVRCLRPWPRASKKNKRVVSAAQHIVTFSSTEKRVFPSSQLSQARCWVFVVRGEARRRLMTTYTKFCAKACTRHRLRLTPSIAIAPTVYLIEGITRMYVSRVFLYHLACTITFWP